MEGPNRHIDAVPTDDIDNDTDSAYAGSEAASITSSLRSSVWNHVYENGRRYQQLRDGSYFLPNDEEEQDRLDMLHHIYRLIQGGRLHAVSLESPQRVLDIGTGTGVWAIDFADEFPEAEVIGVDTSPIQPNWVPPNCRFIIDDIEQPWPYHDNQKFDYIHQRNMSGSIGNWTNLYQQAKDCLRPGGVLEIQEFEVWFYSQTDEGLPEDSAIMKWQKLIQEASSQFGRPLNYASSFRPHLEEAGFEDLQTHTFKVPIGRWAKDRKLREIGMFLQAQMDVAVEAVSLAYFTRALGWSETETQVMIAQARKEFSDPNLRLYTHCWFVSGRRTKGDIAVA